MRSPEEYLLQLNDPSGFRTAEIDWQPFGAAVVDRVVRTDLTAPGFALIDFGIPPTPRAFREMLLALCAAMNAAHRQRFARIVYVSINRFDQQVSTKAHLDGGPEESLLVLGYEPTKVDSCIRLLDYSRCSRDLGLEPKEFLLRYNPIYGEGKALLEKYTTAVEGFDPARYQVLVVNNGSSPHHCGQRCMLGVLHQAVIPKPQPAETRYINSIMMVTADDSDPDRKIETELQAFIDSATPLVG